MKIINLPEAKQIITCPTERRQPRITFESLQILQLSPPLKSWTNVDSGFALALSRSFLFADFSSSGFLFFAFFSGRAVTSNRWGGNLGVLILRQQQDLKAVRAPVGGGAGAELDMKASDWFLSLRANFDQSVPYGPKDTDWSEFSQSCGCQRALLFSVPFPADIAYRFLWN